MTINPTVLRAGEGATIWQLGNHFTVKAAGERTHGHFAMLEQICDGAPAPTHVHENEEEAFYVLAGSVDLYVGEDVHHVEAGAFCLVPRGTPHTSGIARGNQRDHSQPAHGVRCGHPDRPL